MAIAEVSIVPIGTGNTSVSEFVADAVKVLKKSGLNYKLNPMGTIVEGEIKDVMGVITKMHETPFIKGSMRVYTTIKIDDRRDKSVQMKEKVQSVKEKIDI